MIENYILFETAKLAKKKGFDWECWSYYDEKIDKIQKWINFEEDGPLTNNHNSSYISATTQSLLAKWLREIHGLYVDAHPSHTDNKLFKTTFVVEVVHLHKLKLYSGAEQNKDYFESYEEALEVGLFSALNLIKI